MMTREDAQAIYRAGEETVVRVLLEMDALEQQVRELTVRLDASEQRVKHLEDQLAKNSRNSSKPPSTDGFLKPAPKSLREKSARSSGGQPGHAGQTLAMVGKPDRIEPHRVERCACCGRSLAHQPPDDIEKRQAHNLPLGSYVHSFQSKLSIPTRVPSLPAALSPKCSKITGLTSAWMAGDAARATYLRSACVDP